MSDLFDIITSLYDFNFISYYPLGDEELSDIISGYDFTIHNNVITQENSLIPYNNEGSVLFDGGYVTTETINFSEVKIFSFIFFIKTNASSGTIISKEDTFKIEIENGKIKTTFYYTNDTSSTLISNTSINDNEVHFISIEYTNKSILINIDKKLDAVFSDSAVNYKSTVMLFNGNAPNTLLQCRFDGDIKDDCNTEIKTYGGSTIFANDSPFDGKSIYFDGSYHLECFDVLSSTSNYHDFSFFEHNNFTIEFHIKLEYINDWMPIISVGGAFDTGVDFNLWDDGGWSIGIKNDSILFSAQAFDKYKATIDYELDSDTWYHIVIENYNYSIKAYVDGNEASVITESNSVVNSMVGATNPYSYNLPKLNIGGSGYFNGSYGTYRCYGVYLRDLRISRGAIYE